MKLDLQMSTHFIGFARLQLGHLMEAISPVATVADLGSRPLNVIMPHSGRRVRVTGYRGTLVGGWPRALASGLRHLAIATTFESTCRTSD